MDILVTGLESVSLEGSLPQLSTFVYDNEKGTASPKLEDDLRKRLWTALIHNVEADESEEQAKLLYLKAIRILSREKFNLAKYANQHFLGKLVELSSINVSSESDYECSLESLKCLCNLTYNLPDIADTLYTLNFPTFLSEDVSNAYNKSKMEKRLFEMKLLFLITAFSVSSRQSLYKKFGIAFFTNVCIEEGKVPKENLQSGKRKKLYLNEEQMKILSEVLKTSFNILINVRTTSEDFKNYVAVLRELTLVGLTPSTMHLISDIVNALTLLPAECLESLMIPGPTVEKNTTKSPAMDCISVLICFLDAILVKIEEVPGTSKEELSPIVLLLTNLCQANKNYRKFIRSRVLPNLKEIYTRPEVGNTLRNKLCRLLTCPITSTRDLVADFLFILCKESVTRMVKYTGYGNAAGLFANRGLLGNPPQQPGSNSEDSETEEYSQHKHMINPIVGCLTPPRTDETQNMTEEQKEYLALELVNKIDKLQREGLIQPCRIGPDGKPTPVEHVLELGDNVQFPRNSNN